MLKIFACTSLLLAVSAPVFAAPATLPKCGTGFHWDMNQNMCMPNARPTPRVEKPSAPSAPKPAANFCTQYPQDPFCGGGIPAPKPAPRR